MSVEEALGMSEGGDSLFIILFTVYYTFCTDWTSDLKKSVTD